MAMLGSNCFSPLNLGDVFLREYREVRLIGAGGMGAVYEVVDEQGTHARFALKVMHPDLTDNDEFRKRFETEARIPSEIHSDHIVRVIRTGIDDETGAPFLLMDLIRGVDLAKRISPGRGLAPEYLLMLLRQIASTLDKIHVSGIIHRDLKPENLMVVLNDDLIPSVRIVDFGLAKWFPKGGRLTTTLNAGTIAYESPEQMRGDPHIGFAADLYSLGQIVFTLLTGAAYWCLDESPSLSMVDIFKTMEGGLTEPASQRVTRLAARFPNGHPFEFPLGFDEWFAQATAFNPADRFGSAMEMHRSLAALNWWGQPKRGPRQGSKKPAANLGSPPEPAKSPAKLESAPPREAPASMPISAAEEVPSPPRHVSLVPVSTSSHPARRANHRNIVFAAAAAILLLAGGLFWATRGTSTQVATQAPPPAIPSLVQSVSVGSAPVPSVTKVEAPTSGSATAAIVIGTQNAVPASTPSARSARPAALKPAAAAPSIPRAASTSAAKAPVSPRAAPASNSPIPSY